jgi:hypothetical protein
VTADRNRVTSVELTEVRTVLSRAETARDTLAYWLANETSRKVARGGRWDFEATPPAWVDATYDADPDTAEMLAALDQAIALLDRWRRKGRTKTP